MLQVTAGDPVRWAPLHLPEREGDAR
jgi:hypothetical protein